MTLQDSINLIKNFEGVQEALQNQDKSFFKKQSMKFWNSWTNSIHSTNRTKAISNAFYFVAINI
jgi:hypothetical protein